MRMSVVMPEVLPSRHLYCVVTVSKGRNLSTSSDERALRRSKNCAGGIVYIVPDVKCFLGRAMFNIIYLTRDRIS